MTKSGKFTLKALALFALLLSAASFCYAQTDTVYFNNEKIPCSVKEVTPDMVKFVLPGEQVLNSIYRTNVAKIVFKNGRIQPFPEANYYRTVKAVTDYDAVGVAASEDDIHGLYEIADVASSAFSNVSFASVDIVKDRAYQKLKVQAAMFGSTMIYITGQDAGGTDLSEGSSPKINLTGIVYASSLLDFGKFQKLIAGKTDLFATEIYKTSESDTNLSHDVVNQPFKITNVSNENGIIKITGDLKGEKNVHTFQLASFTDNGFNVAYIYNRAAYSVRVSW